MTPRSTHVFIQRPKTGRLLHSPSLLGHLACVQLLIERGAWLEGYNALTATDCNNMQHFSETPQSSTQTTHFCETPLQVAAAAGHYEVVIHLLDRGADPYLTSLLRPGVSFTYTRGGAHNAFTLAAAHGHK